MCLVLLFFLHLLYIFIYFFFLTWFRPSPVTVVEVMEPKMRISAGYVVYTFWAFATMLYGFIGYFLRDWRILQTVLTLPGLLILPVLWWVIK